jgi:hypothetical protein
MYATLNIIALILIFLLVPETKLRTLEELDRIFAIPTTTFARYQLTVTLPAFFKRWVLWRSDVVVQPLHQFDRMKRGAAMDQFDKMRHGAAIHRSDKLRHKSSIAEQGGLVPDNAAEVELSEVLTHRNAAARGLGRTHSMS